MNDTGRNQKDEGKGQANKDTPYRHGCLVHFDHNNASDKTENKNKNKGPLRNFLVFVHDGVMDVVLGAVVTFFRSRRPPDERDGFPVCSSQSVLPVVSIMFRCCRKMTYFDLRTMLESSIYKNSRITGEESSNDNIVTSTEIHRRILPIGLHIESFIGRENASDVVNGTEAVESLVGIGN